MRYEDGEVFWIYCFEKRRKFFLGFVKILSDNTATTLKCTVLVANSVQVVLIDVSASWWRGIVEKGLTLLGFFL